MTVKKQTTTTYTYTTPEGDEFQLTHEPVESSIKAIKTETGYTVKYLVQDSDCSSPRENDNLGVMACFHSRYTIGDKDHGLSQEEVQEAVKTAFVALPVYLMDHSGLSFSTKSFNDPWDSGCVGAIFVTKEKAMKEYGNLSDETKEIIRGVLIAEVETYNQWQSGDCYGIVAEHYDADREQVDEDSCWGFIGEKWALEALDSEI